MILKDEGYGCTEFSIMFFRQHRQQLGVITHIEMIDCDDWPLRIKDVVGNEMWLSGCTSGYGGEGPHGTHTILQECGINLPFGFIKSHNAFTIENGVAHPVIIH